MTLQTDEKLLLARLEDLEQGTERGNYPHFSRFLDPGECALFLERMHPQVPYMLWGGYEDAERKMLGFFPDYMEPEPSLFPIAALRLSAPEKPGHRTILGSLMALGIERNLLGDVAMEEHHPVIFACDSISEYLCLNLTRAGRLPVTLTEVPFHELTILPRAWEPVCGTVASLRLDCVLGLLTGASRSTAEQMIRHEQVSVNHSVCTKTSFTVSQGDVLSVRKFGRAELLDIIGETKKGRMRIVLKKFI